MFMAQTFQGVTNLFSLTLYLLDTRTCQLDAELITESWMGQSLGQKAILLPSLKWLWVGVCVLPYWMNLMDSLTEIETVLKGQARLVIAARPCSPECY